MWLQNMYLIQGLPDHCTQFCQCLWKYLLPATVELHTKCVCYVTLYQQCIFHCFEISFGIIYCSAKYHLRNMCTKERDCCATFAIVIMVFLGMLNYVLILFKAFIFKAIKLIVDWYLPPNVPGTQKRICFIHNLPLQYVAWD